MKKIYSLILAAGALWISPFPEARAQSTCPQIATGAVLTAAQWNNCFTRKQDYLGFTPINPNNLVGTAPILVSTTGSQTTIGFDFTLHSPLILSGDPTTGLGAATKQYVDTIALGIQIKPSAATATTANITLSGEQTIDGVLTSVSEVLVKNQTTASQNGIYTSASGAWNRIASLDTWSEAIGALVFVSGGSTQSGTQWLTQISPGGTIGSTAMPWAQFGAVSAYSAGTGITLTGSTFSLTAPVAISLGGTNATTSSAALTNLGALPLAGGTMTGLLILSADPVANLGAATKQYVDAVSLGIQAKPAAATATTANITLVGEQTIDGVLTSTSEVLVKNQATPSQNGIYTSASGAWARIASLDTWSEAIGALVFVSGGSTQANTQWITQVTAGGTIGTTAMPWVQFGGVTAYSAGTGITLTGTTFSITAPIAIALGGTNATTAAGALTSLGAVPLAGGTMTGLLTLSANPTTNLQAATKQYVDANVGGATGELWAGAFGAVCNGFTDDTTAFQALINAAVAAKKSARFFGSCVIATSTSLTITGALLFQGVSESAAGASRLIVGGAHDAIVITTSQSVNLEQFHIDMSGQTTTTGIVFNPAPVGARMTASISGTTMTVTAVIYGALSPGLLVQDPTPPGTGVAANTTVVSQLTGSTGGTGTYQVSISQTVTSRLLVNTGIPNDGSLIRDVHITGGAYGVQMLANRLMTIDHTTIFLTAAASVLIDFRVAITSNACDNGDHNFTNNWWGGAPTSDGLVIRCGGGIKFTSNKINGVRNAVDLSVGLGAQDFPSTSHMFTGNSIEGIGAGLFVHRGDSTHTSSTSSIEQIVLNGNELVAQAIPALMINAFDYNASPSIFLQNVVINNNSYVAIANGTAMVSLYYTRYGTIIGNNLVYNGGAASTISMFQFGSGVSNFMIGPNKASSTGPLGASSVTGFQIYSPTCIDVNTAGSVACF